MRNHTGVAVIGLLACFAWTSPAFAVDLIPQLKGNWCDVRNEKDAPTDVVRVGIIRPNEITLTPAVICNIDEIFEQQGDTHFVVSTSCSSGGHKWNMELDLISANLTNSIPSFWSFLREPRALIKVKFFFDAESILPKPLTGIGT